MKKIFTIFCITAAFFSTPVSLFAQHINVNDSMALVDLYNSTDGTHWGRSEKWLKKPVINWEGISLTEDSTRVKEVYLLFNNLNGEIPSSLGNLTACDYIDLGSNSLRGKIPASLGNLNSVQRLFLGGNQLSGEIPESLGRLPNLTWLELNWNRLSGNIPDNLGSIPNIYKLDISRNKFTFNGMESLVQKHIPNFISYGQDTILQVGHRNDTLFVSAGGTLHNNTYVWYNSGGPNSTITGDSTYVPKNTGNYYVTVTNSIATDFWLQSNLVFASPIAVIDPNPTMITADGSISTNISNIDYNKKVTKAATDGATKLLLVCNSTSPVTFTIESNNFGTLSSLSNQLTTSKQITVNPGVNDIIVAVYTVPDGYGKDNQANKGVYVTAANNTGIIGRGFFQLVKPPVVLVHGMWSNPDIWRNGGFIKALNNANFSNTFLADYSAHSATTFNPESPASLPGRNSVATAVSGALFFYRSKGIAVTQVDIVGHSLGGLMTRSWSQQSDFNKLENYQKGYIHKLITLGTPHRGSPLGPELVASQNNLVRISSNATVPIPLWLVLTLAGMPIGSCHADFGVTSPGINALKATPPYKTYSIVGNELGQIVGYAAFYAASLAVFNHSYPEIFRAHAPCTNTLDNDLVVPLSSQQGYISTSQTFISTGHSIPAFNTETNSTDIQNKVIDLLLSDNASEFSAGFPAPSSFPLDCTTANQRIPIDSSKHLTRPASASSNGNQAIKIVSPVRGATYNQNSGSSIKLQYEKVGDAKPYNCVFMVQGTNWLTITDSATNSTTFTLPDNSPTGDLNIVLIGRDSSGIILGDTLHITVTPTNSPDSLAVNPSIINLDSSSREVSLQVQGYYHNSNGELGSNNLRSASNGTVYQAKNGNFFTVTTDGLVIAKRVGSDTLIVTNGSKTVKVPVTVDNTFAFSKLYPNAIDFPAIPDKYAGDVPFALQATSSSGENVIYSLISGPAILSNGVVSLNNIVGSVTIKASSPKTAYFDSAISITRTFNVLNSSTYTFIGNGNWSNAQNWVNNILPPVNLPNGVTISINPIEGGECIVDIPIVIPPGTFLTVEPGKKFRVLGNFLIQ